MVYNVGYDSGLTIRVDKFQRDEENRLWMFLSGHIIGFIPLAEYRLVYDFTSCNTVFFDIKKRPKKRGRKKKTA